MELLIMLANRSDTDPTKDRWLYKRGDLVAIHQDGEPWGREELPETANPRVFAIITVTGINPTDNQIAKWLKARDISGQELRRLWSVAVASVPAAVRNQILNTGRYTTTWETFKNFIVNKVTGETGLGS